MMGCLRSLLGKIALTMLFIAAVCAVGLWGPSAYPKLREWAGLAPPPAPEGPGSSPELADSVLTQVQAFRERGEGRMALGGREVTSVLRYSFPGLIPSGIRDPAVELRDGRLHLSAEVVLSSFPDLPDLGPVLGILPDTLAVVLHASLMPFGQEESALLVHGIEASGIPIPRRLIPEILRAMGRVGRPGLPPEALAVPLPAGLGSAYILTDSLIISSVP
jgi:hypothetical protein